MDFEIWFFKFDAELILDMMHLILNLKECKYDYNACAYEG